MLHGPPDPSNAESSPLPGSTERIAGLRRFAARAAARIGGHRGILTQLGLRALWVVALVLLAWGGEHLLDATQAVDETRLTVPFALGATLCAMVVVLASARRLRWTALVLGAAHGAGWVLSWSALA